MSGFLDDIVAATEGAPLREMHVPEWGQTVYWRPLTLARHDEITRRSGKSMHRKCAVTLMLAGLDKAGQPLFEDNAETLLTIEAKLDGVVVSRIAMRILGDETGDEAGEASAPTRS